MKVIVILATTILLAAGTSGCSREFIGGAAVGAGGVGAAYEYQNKQALDQLEADFRAGRIDKDEYLARKKAIQDKSLLY